MGYTISINLSSDDNQNYTATATYDGSQNETSNYTFTVPSINKSLFGYWNYCYNSYILSQLYYNCDASYIINLYSTYLSDATISCPNAINITNTNEEPVETIQLFSYTSTCTSSSNSFGGNYLDTSVNLLYNINTNIVSNVNCNTNINSLTVTPGQKNTTYNFYNNSVVILTIQVTSNYSSSGVWTVQNAVITNYAASQAQTIVAISFLCNMYYNISYYTYMNIYYDVSMNYLNDTSINCQLIVVNSLAPIIQLFNQYL